MSSTATDRYGALTEREKQTLRLILRGHDAKSAARHLDLSVHTINERLRDARRKLAVSSSREAARLVLDREGVADPALGGPAPEFLVPERIGEAAAPDAVPPVAPPNTGGRRMSRFALLAIGAVIMSLTLGLLFLAAQPGVAPASAPDATAVTTNAATEAAARQWLALVDQYRWDDSWKATGESFRTLNTSQVWADVSTKVRVPLGAVRSRVLLSQESVPVPPAGAEMVKFRTSFAGKPDTIETLSLAYEGGAWRVVGYIIG